MFDKLYRIHNFVHKVYIMFIINQSKLDLTEIVTVIDIDE